MDYSDLFKNVHRRPGMYGLANSYSAMVAFIMGCDAGNSWRLLDGFREWLIVREGGAWNLGWPALVVREAQRREPRGQFHLSDAQGEEEDRVAIETLVDLLVEFLPLRDRHGGLEDIYARHFALKAQLMPGQSHDDATGEAGA